MVEEEAGAVTDRVVPGPERAKLPKNCLRASRRAREAAALGKKVELVLEFVVVATVVVVAAAVWGAGVGAGREGRVTAVAFVRARVAIGSVEATRVRGFAE